MTTAKETTGQAHVKELALRRFWAGELMGPEGPAIEAHAAACPRCRARLKELTEEQRRFEQEISFDRFAAGVHRAARAPRRARLPAPNRRARWLFPALGAAAVLALTITFAPRLGPRGGGGGEVDVGGERGANRIKGGSGITVQIAAAVTGPQRTAAVDAPEPLSPGERIRIGYQPGAHGYVTALSIDEQGQVTPLYPETGRSLPIDKAAATATRYLPDSVEFTGGGGERLIVILGDQPLDIEIVKKAAHDAFLKGGRQIARLAPLDVPGEQFQRLFVKP